jgi:hypothetical protein
MEVGRAKGLAKSFPPLIYFTRCPMLNASLYTVIDKAITKTEGRSVQEYVLCSMVLANIYVQDRGKWG